MVKTIGRWRTVAFSEPFSMRSAKKNRLSGFVPFVQISGAAH